MGCNMDKNKDNNEIRMINKDDNENGLENGKYCYLNECTAMNGFTFLLLYWVIKLAITMNGC